MDPAALAGYMAPDPDGPLLTPIQWGIVWAVLYVNADGSNAEIRSTIEAYFADNGVDPAQLQAMAEMGKNLAAGMTPPPDTPAA